MQLTDHCTLPWLIALALAAPHVLYGFIWFFPQRWRRRFGKDSVLVFDTIAWVLKVVQFSSVLYWAYQTRRPGPLIDAQQLSVLNVAAGFGLLGAGQTLNVGIFRAIGHVGVYYGTKLGHQVPWVDGFPFNVVKHPQYVGAVLSIWGMVVGLGSQRPPGSGAIAVYWTLLYVVTAVQEQYF